ncbi:MAG: hypothetical protein ACP6IS_07550 [Candidatus Asgardarchaeia archaeon]
MAIVKISKRRIHIPSKIDFRGEKAIIIPFGKGLLVYPIPANFKEIDIPKSIAELKELAEKKAREDALNKLEKREQNAD